MIKPQTSSPPSSSQFPNLRLSQPDPQEVMVQLQGVTKRYANGRDSLAGVDLTLQRGAFLFITGASGTGKSTLLKLLYGAECPSAGKIMVNSQDVTQLTGDRLSLFRRHVGIIFQDYKLIPRRTVTENIAFVLRARGCRWKEIDKRLFPALKLVGLQHKANYFPEQLSGGEQQRVSIARAIVGTPPLILADEPTGNLDPYNAQRILKILQKLNSYGATVLVTTHDERLVTLSPHPVAQLRDGRLFWLRG